MARIGGWCRSWVGLALCVALGGAVVGFGPSARARTSRLSDAPGTAEIGPGAIERVVGQPLTVAAASAVFDPSGIEYVQLAVEPGGSVLLADGFRVRRIANGSVTVLAGTGESTTQMFGDGGPGYGSPFGRLS